MTAITIRRPDDWHLHLRAGAMLTQVARHSAERFSRALIMPNLNPPVVNVPMALDYREEILQAAQGYDFNPLMALYLTDNTVETDIRLAAQTGVVVAFKLYPAGATTNSASGVKDVDKILSVVETIAKYNLVLCVHGEVVNPEVDVFDREAVFIDEVMATIRREIPELRIVLEHISTKQGIDFVKANSNIAGTITAHHLLENRNVMFKGGINPHHYCLPILKRAGHQRELIKAAISGDKKFFAGTDSAPHPKHAKESACGCAGIYTAHGAVELYAEVFAENNALDKFEGFVSVNGAQFYNLPLNHGELILEHKPWQVPDEYFTGTVVPYRAGQNINWSIV